jgi:HK97 family phage portal protein
MADRKMPDFANPANYIQHGKKDSLASWMAFFGMTDAQSGDYSGPRDWARAAADEPFLNACIKLKSMSAGAVPLRVYVRQENNLIPADLAKDADAAEYQKLLDTINPYSMSASDFRGTLVASLSVYGEAYVRKVRGKMGGPPQELYLIRPIDITPKMGKTWIEAYEYNPSGSKARNSETEIIPAKDIVAFRLPGNFVDPTRGLSPLSAIRREVEVSVMASEHTNALLRNLGVPVGAWVAPKDSDLTVQDQSAIKKVLAALSGPKNAGKSAVLPGGLEWQQLGIPEQDAQYLNARKISRMAIASAMGIPLQLVGDDEHSGVYRSVRDAEQVFWRRLKNELGWIADILDSWLTTEFDTTGRLTVQFDVSSIEALRPTPQEELMLWTQLMDRSVVTPNEVRAHFGLGAPTSWGDTPLLGGQPKEGVTGKTPVSITEVPVQGTAVEEDHVVDAPPIMSWFDRETRLYGRQEIKQFVAGGALDASSMVGFPVTDAEQQAIELGVKRRYSSKQIARGVAEDGYQGLRGVQA